MSTLTLADGTVLDLATGKPVVSERVERKMLVEVPTNTEAQVLVANTRKRIADLPDIPKRMNFVAAVLSYKLFGLSDFDIATALSCTEERVAQVFETDVYKRLSDEVVRTILERDADDVRHIFKQGSRNAAKKLMQLADSENETVALSATKDILDRAGHSPAQIIQHNHSMSGGLEIVVTKRDAHNVLDGELVYDNDSSN